MLKRIKKVLIKDKAKRLYNSKKYTEALDVLLDLYNIYPDDIELCNDIGGIYFILQRYEEANDCFSKVIKFDSDNDNCYFNKGLVLSCLGKRAAAISLFDKVIEMNCSLVAEAYISKGVELSLLKRYEEAIQCQEEALKIKPEESYSVLINKAADFIYLERYDEALRLYKITEKQEARQNHIEGSKGFSKFYMSAIHAKLNNKDQSLKLLKEAIKINPMRREQAKENILFDNLRNDEDFDKLIYS